jgi:hypothetical protein
LPVFFIGAVLGSPLLGLFLPPIGFGSGVAWNGYDATAGIAGAIAGLKKAYQGESLHGNAQEALFSSLDLTTSLGLVAGQAMSLTSSTLHLIVIGAPAASVAFAACMLSSATRAIYHTVRAYQKTDPCYLLADRLAKLEENTRRRNNAPQNGPSYKEPASTEFLRKEAQALYAVLSEKASTGQDKTLEEKLNGIEDKYKSTFKSENVEKKATPTAEERILYSLIMDKQEKKFQQNRLSAFNWSSAAIVMSAVAATVILAAVGIVCPPLAIAAGILTIGVGAMKGYEFYQHHVAPSVALNKKMQEIIKSKQVNSPVHDSLLTKAIKTHVKTKDPQNSQQYDHGALASMLSKKHQDELIRNYCQNTSANSDSATSDPATQPGYSVAVA